MAALKETAMRVLPSELRNEVVSELLAEERHPSPLHWLLVCAALLAAVALFWWQFPARRAIMQVGDIEIATEAVAKSSPYYNIALKAEELFEAKKYSACAETIAPVLLDILENQEEHDSSHNRLLYQFYESVRKGRVAYDIDQMARVNIGKVVAANPDEARWGILQIELCAKEFIAFEELYRNVQKHKGDKGFAKERRVQADKWIKTVTELLNSLSRQLPGTTGRGHDDMLKDIVWLKLLHAKMLCCRWMLEGQGKFPDDFGDAGVDSREQALQICHESEQRYSELGSMDAELLDFFYLRRFIAQVIKDHLSLVNHSYYWNGEKRWSILPLMDEIAAMDAVLKKPGTGGKR
jgi:hypothetical protein